MKKINLANKEKKLKSFLLSFQDRFSYDFVNDKFLEVSINSKPVLFDEAKKIYYSYDQQARDAAEEAGNKESSRTTDKKIIRKARKEAIKKAKQEALNAAVKFLEKPYHDFANKEKGKAYDFVNLLGVKICPYCNINYTYSVFSEEESPICRPDLDHFLSIKKYPQYQLRLKNLVPSCSVCNSRLKRDIDFANPMHLNPYEKSFDDIKSFDYVYKGLGEYDEDKIKIIFRTNPNSAQNEIIKADLNIKDFALAERYQCHRDSVIDLLKRIDKVRKNHFFEVLTYNSTLSLDSIKELLFPELFVDIDTVSLGKLKKDILEKYLPI